ncbi:MAG: hypothetical protein IKG11_03460, partial [Atopobiaceae bacterium]|nr:hypothetical protein [Atopobiaceae bacterium]
MANAAFATMVGKDKSPMLKAALEQGRTMLMKKRTKMKTACSVVTSAVLALSLALTPGGAAMAEEVLVDDAVANDAATDEGVPEWAVDD